MITKTFICDKCNKSVGEADLRQITVRLTNPNTSSYDKSNISVNKDICTSCLRKANIITDMTDEDRVKNAEILAKNTKTVEDKLLEILEDLGVLFEE